MSGARGAMDLERMLAKCRRGQWHIDDLDWTASPRRFSREDEIQIVQYFTDMSGIEVLAARLFEVQRDRTRDPVLREIFETFIADEIRHSQVAERLARHYDVHRYRRYAMNPHLVRFRRDFVELLRHVSAEIANAYIITGELLLDIALLRSLDEFVDDDMSRQAMRLINRDESRHIAIDYYMVEYYSSPAYAAWLAGQPRQSIAELLRAWMIFSRFLWRAGPFIRSVFFEPMDRVDPSGHRLRQAFKRIQLLGEKEEVGRRPFSRFMRGVQDAFNDPVKGRLLGPALARVMGLDPRVIRPLYTSEEARRAREVSFEALAEDALRAKEAEP